MKKCLPALAALAAVPPLAAVPALAATTAIPHFAVLKPHGTVHPGAKPPASLLTWTGTISYGGHSYGFRMVGKNPATTNTTSTLTVYVIPIKMVYGQSNGNKTFDPNTATQNGVTITQNLLNSPLFNSLDWKWGSLDMGSTQYEDAFQRGSFWSKVKTHTAYHVVFKTPSVLTEQSITVSAVDGQVINNPFGSGVVGTDDINAFDSSLQTFMSQFSQINPTVLPLFLTYDIYLTSGGSCCIGGYHSADTNGQSYAYATYVDSAGAFSQDISAFSHELGEWYDDPLITSSSPCGILEVGDPLETLANYGDFSVVFGGVTWHPQALAFMEYFGEPKNYSANNWLDNKHHLSTVCQNGA